MKLDIVMPSMRGFNLPIILDGFNRSDWTGIDMLWHLIVTPTEHKGIPKEVLDYPNIRIHVLELEKATDKIDGLRICGLKINHSLSFVREDTYTFFMSDDNLLPLHIPQVWRSVVEDTGKKVIVVSHLRGQRTVYHEHTPFIAAPENVTIGQISGEQLIVHKSILGAFSTSPNSDGEKAEELWRAYPEEVHFIPDQYTTFDALDLRRWDREERDKAVGWHVQDAKS